MSSRDVTPVAIVGISAIMPQAPDGEAFWANIKSGRYSITDVPPGRWDPALYWDPDHSARDKTYSKVGGWVREFHWDPVRWRLPVPPTVAKQMDEGQRWAVSAAREALVDAGWPNWNVDNDRVATIVGNALGGEKHYQSSLRLHVPEVLKALRKSTSLLSLPVDMQEAIVAETHREFQDTHFEITEDTMPGELANVHAGRIANLFNLRGMNYTTDAACASGLAALNSAVLGLAGHQYDAAVTGGVDRNMGLDGFVKFCKIGALSESGSRPFDAGADGFVMGEGCALFVLKRLEDAERDGDKIYAVILGIGGSSDGKGKGITAPNPIGQQLAIARGWENAGQDPTTASAIEAHGTSTRVGDAVELDSLMKVFGAAGAPPRSIALGSVKSNIGHLKAAAGAAGLFKMVRSLHEKVLPPSLNFNEPNPIVDWDANPCVVNTELREWPAPPAGIRRAGLSAFGFGGTNFHVVLEEYVPGRHKPRPKVFASAEVPDSAAVSAPVSAAVAAAPAKVPLRGALVLGGRDDAEVLAQLRSVLAAAQAGQAPAPRAPDPALAQAEVRAAIDYGSAEELAGKADKLIKAMTTGNAGMFKLLRSQGAFVGRGPAPKVAFLYTGQGSQYANMLKTLSATEPIVRSMFDEADRVMTPLLGRPLTSYIFIDGEDPAAVKQLEAQLRQTEITQPAVLATDLALTNLMAAYGITPDMVMGHSLGEYGALVAAGSLTFDAALEAVSARGREMTRVSVGDNGAMAAVFGPLTEIQRIVEEIDGYVVVANINSNTQAVIGGNTEPVMRAIEKFIELGMRAIQIPVSHAFHTSIVAPAAGPLVEALRRLNVVGPRVPVVANVNGEFYPADSDTEVMLDYLGKQVASPVQFVKGLNTLYEAGARVFVEMGPKKALHGFVEDVLVGQHDDVVNLFTNHHKSADDVAFNQALCGLFASGHGFGQAQAPVLTSSPAAVPAAPAPVVAPAPGVAPAPVVAPAPGVAPAPVVAGTPQAGAGPSDATITELGKLFAGVLEQGLKVYGVDQATMAPAAPAPAAAPASVTQPRRTEEPVVVTGCGLGLPGVPQVFDDANVANILAGRQFIESLPQWIRDDMIDKNIVRLVKDEARGASWARIDDPEQVIKLAGQRAPLDVVKLYDIDAARDEALDICTKLAVGAGFEALRDAGIPLVMRYKQTTIGSQLPDKWALPEAMQDDTGIVFCSVFPGATNFGEHVRKYATHQARVKHLLALEGLKTVMDAGNPALGEVDRLIGELKAEMEAEPNVFNRRFLFRVLAMGHSQFAEIIGARGPNTQINAACATTTQGVAIAEDWIRTGRCRRVLIIAGDDVTNSELMPWIASGFLATGAAATDEKVEDAALPFDRRRHGMIIGMGAAALVLESAGAARERGVQPIAELVGSVIANSAYHGTRLNVDHISGVMETLIRQVEGRGLNRHEIAPKTMFVSHETYTPARGGSAAAEIKSLRDAFGASTDKIVITNTKGFTGHAMGAGIEDVVAIKALESGIVPPVPNFKEPDPELGNLNLSKGGRYDVEYSLRLAAGFGSQVAMSLYHWTPMPDKQRRDPRQMGYQYRVIDHKVWQAWLDRMSGHPGSILEVDHRKLRVADTGAPVNPMPTTVTLPVPYEDTLSSAPMMGLKGAGATAPPAPAAAAPSAPAAAVPPAVAAPTPAATLAAAPLAAPASPATAAQPPPAPAGDGVLDTVTGIVSQLTGYPPDLLDPELDLEADLGVDTVKQAEVFAAVRERYNLERDDNLKLRDFPTLNHVAGWVRDRAGIAVTVPAASAPAGAAGLAAPTPAAAGPVIDPVLRTVTGIVSGLTGYPPDLLDPDLDLEADLGVDTVKQAEVFAAVREEYALERDENLQLRDFPTLNHVVGWVRQRAGLPEPSAAPTPPVAVVSTTVEVAAPAAPGAAFAGDQVLAAVTRIVAELTGYPTDLLDPDLDLEADLGVDTVKQAEVFSAVREEYSLERDDNLQLRDFPTLNHVAGWVRERAGIAVPSAPATAVAAGEAVASAPAVGGDEVLAAVTRIVAELTGYPTDLLDPDLDLEADLGVDTVKQAEVFSAVREEYSLERDDNLQLRDFPTLNHVAGWVRERAGIAVPSAPATAVAAGEAVASAPAVGGDEVLAAVTRIVAELTGYPTELLDPDLDLEADLGVDTVKQAEVFSAVREEYSLERDDNLQLRDFPTLNHVAGWVRERAGIAAPATAAAAPSVAAPAPAAAPEASEASSAGLAAATDGDPVLASVTRIVADLTGYPTELLDPDLDLEADLGVDTVKQAEVFSAVREEYSLERDDNLQLRDFPTLNHVAGWVRERAGIGAGAPAAEATSSLGSSATAPTADLIAGDLGAIDALPRRIPCPTLRPSLGQCVETGVNLDGARVLVMLDEGGVGQALVTKLERSGASVLTLDVGVSTEELSARLDEWLAAGPISGVYWLPALDDDGDLASYDLAQWQEALRRRVKTLYTTMRRMWDTSPFLVSATRLGGYHGYDTRGATSVLGGAVTGFTKSYKKERPYALVKAVDLPPSRKTAKVADILLEETLLDPGAVEIGRAEDKRFGVAFTEQPFPALAEDGSCQGDSGIVLRPDSVFLITGAAGSIVSAITADLAKAAGGGTFHLLDLAPEPQADDADIAAFRTDKDALKATLAARMKEAGERPTPVAIDRVLAGLERKSAALAGIEAIAAAGGTCHYYSVNLTDGEAVGAVMEQVTSTSGRIDVLLHAAGLEISRDLPQKEPSEYDLVFDVKINGWFNVWKAAQTMDVGATVAFSSVAGRFGNQGQTDYAAANDLLCKITSNMRRNRPQTRALATDWTAWGGIGMATRGSIPKIMEAAGVQMLPPEAGVAWIRRELTSWDFSGEIIVAGVLGMMAAEIHESGGMDVGAVLGNRQNGPMTDHVTLSTIYGVVNTVTLDPKEQPFLYDHRIDGTALLPGVMGMESFAETASLIAPAGYRIGAVEGVGFNAPVKFFRDEPRTLRITAVITPDPVGGSDLIAHCQLSGQRNLPGRDKPEVTVHFTGTVRLTQEPAAQEREEVSLEFGERQVGKDTIYTFFFHGPAYQVIGNAARFADGAMTRMEDNLPDNHIPGDRPTLNAPRLAELCFQTAGLWEAGREQRMALPLKVDRVRVLRDPATVEGALFGLARQVGEGLFDCAIVDGGGSVVVRMDGYGTISVPSGIPEEVAGALKHTYGDE